MVSETFNLMKSCLDHVFFRLNTSPRAAADFWQGKSLWQPTWNSGTSDAHLQVDYVRVWAL